MIGRLPALPQPGPLARGAQSLGGSRSPALPIDAGRARGRGEQPARRHLGPVVAVEVAVGGERAGLGRLIASRAWKTIPVR